MGGRTREGPAPEGVDERPKRTASGSEDRSASEAKKLCSKLAPKVELCDAQHSNTRPRVDTAEFPGRATWKHPAGLYNKGSNICFANSTLQCLFRTPEMTRLIKDEVSKTQLFMTDDEQQFISSYLTLQEECTTGRLRPSTQDSFMRLCRVFMPQIISSSSQGQEQQDAAEFFMTLLQVIHEILNSTQNATDAQERDMDDFDGREKIRVPLSRLNRQILNVINGEAYKDWQDYKRCNDSPIVQLFTGQTSDVRQCVTCLKTSIHTEIYNVLSVPIERLDRRATMNSRYTALHLSDLLMYYTAVKRMGNRETGSDTPTGPICNMAAHTTWLERTVLSQAPSAAVLQLLRFKYDPSTAQSKKLQLPVKVPSKKMRLPNASGTWPEYDLYGVVAHIGSASTQEGHYVAFSEADIGGKWYRFDDESVTFITDIDQELAKPFLMENAYLLFYRKT